MSGFDFDFGDREILGLQLRLTCHACPEQYDVYLGDEQVAYFRLRHGCFTAEVPDCGGTEVFYDEPNGDGQFDRDERDDYLTAACKAVLEHLYKEDQDP